MSTTAQPAITLHVNGRARTIASEAGAPLLEVLRNELGLKGTRFGCGAEACGACMVLLDGAAVTSCTLAVGDVAGRRVTTIEGLGRPEAPHVLQRAFLAEQAAQCGYCTSGMVIGAAALLARIPNPTADDVRAALEPHLCRCGSHNRIVRAVLRAASAAGAAGGAGGGPRGDDAGGAAA